MAGAMVPALDNGPTTSPEGRAGAGAGGRGRERIARGTLGGMQRQRCNAGKPDALQPNRMQCSDTGCTATTAMQCNVSECNARQRVQCNVSGCSASVSGCHPVACTEGATPGGAHCRPGRWTTGGGVECPGDVKSTQRPVTAPLSHRRRFKVPIHSKVSGIVIGLEPTISSRVRGLCRSSRHYRRIVGPEDGQRPAPGLTCQQTRTASQSLYNCRRSAGGARYRGRPSTSPAGRARRPRHPWHRARVLIPSTHHRRTDP